MDRRIRLLLEVFDQAFTGSSWHGTPLWGSVRGVTAREALWRPGRSRHNIWELVLHAAYWKCMVRRRLLADPAITFPRRGSNWPRLPEWPDAATWKRDTALLKREHELLRRAIARFRPARLARRGWRSKWSNVEHIFGIASHDLYHAGQIQLLKRLSRAGNR
jgi:transposase-like protein